MVGSPESVRRAMEKRAVKKLAAAHKRDADAIRAAITYLSNWGGATGMAMHELEMFADQIERGEKLVDDFARVVPPEPVDLNADHYDPSVRKGSWYEAGGHPFDPNPMLPSECLTCDEPEETMCHPHPYRESNLRRYCFCGRKAGSIVHRAAMKVAS